jgi:subtilase family serine protease
MVRPALLVVAAASVAGLASAASAQAALVRVGSAPRVPAAAKATGPLPSSTRIRLTLALSPRDPLAMANYASAVSTPGSSVYHQFLTVPQFRARFAPSAAQVAQVRASLRARGLSPGPLAANGLELSVTATAGEVGRAFSVGLERYRLRGGRIAFVNRQAPALDQGVAGLVQGVVGLNTVAVPRPMDIRRRTARARAGRALARVATGGPQPCSAASAVNNQFPLTYTADQIASAYRFSSLYDLGDRGAGQTIALYELEPHAASDVAAYQACYGTSTSVTDVPVDGGAGPGGGAGEAALDIEDLIGLAPAANILVYSGPNSNLDSPGSGPYDTYAAIISQNRASVISTSWGVCEPLEGSQDAQGENTLFQEAAIQGQSIVSASGDAGAEDCTDLLGNPTGGLAVDDPAGQPFVTGAGGTSLDSLGPPPAEIAWNSLGGATGGGISALWSMPSYQSSASSSLGVINARSSGVPCSSRALCRQVPDVAADADPNTGYAIYFAGGWTSVGGTSVASPTWGALLALTNASPVCRGSRLGFANPALYRVASNLYSSAFNDITAGNNVITSAGGYSAGPGYDMVTGLGTPNGAVLPAALCDRLTVSGPGSQSGFVGTRSSVRVSATSAAGARLMFSATGLPAGLAINPSTGVISGTLTRSGAYGVNVAVHDADGSTAAAAFAWSVRPVVVTMTKPKNQTSPAGQHVRLTLSARSNNGHAPSFSAHGLPVGLSVNSRTGLISGVARRAGRYVVTAVASDPSGASGSSTFTWAVNGRLSAPSSALTGLAKSRPKLAFKLVASAASGAITNVSLSLPRGLSIAGGPGLARGIVLRGGSGQPLRFSAHLSHGQLVLTLRAGAGSVAIGLGSPTLRISAVLVRQVAAGSVSSLAVNLRVTDSTRASSLVGLTLRPS